jgi:ribosomal protein S18 acetylase RimI-like enzyme
MTGSRLRPMAPDVRSRPATPSDLSDLVRLYRLLESEMVALEEMWPLADGLPEPVEMSIADSLSDPCAHLVVGTIDAVPVGFALGLVRPLLAHTGQRIGAITLVFTEPEARGVGVGEAMRDDLIGRFTAEGVDRFDAHVVPGHRLAKNFFESAGFSARHIVMHTHRPTP